MIEQANVRYVVISYNDEGLLSPKELEVICKKYAVEGSFEIRKIPYTRYSNKTQSPAHTVTELMFYFKKKFIKSPLNYTGGKYKLLSQIEPLFPQHIETMVDLFCGGCDVAVNIPARKIYTNDINLFLIDIFRKLQQHNIDEILKQINDIIERYALSKTNTEGYYTLRQNYNKAATKDPLELFTLICYSFNHQIRFNSGYEYNNPFGKNRSAFNESIKQNLINFHRRIQNLSFQAMDFRDYDFSLLRAGDFVYADPPYSITTATYNDGKRGFLGWSCSDNLALFEILDKLNERGILFAMSNVLEHKGQKNDELIKWAQKYEICFLDKTYRHSNYQKKIQTKQLRS